MMGLTPPAAAALLVAGTLVMIANLLTYAILGQINARLPENERLSYMGFHLGKNSRMAHLSKHFYPSGRLLRASQLCFAGAVVCMVLVVRLDR
jgi:hypothetical protein